MKTLRMRLIAENIIMMERGSDDQSERIISFKTTDDSAINNEEFAGLLYCMLNEVAGELADPDFGGREIN